MSIEVTNPSRPSIREFSVDELEVGGLYKQAGSNADTVFVKTLQRQVVWFESGRIGSDNGAHRSYVRAPEGTKVILT